MIYDIDNITKELRTKGKTITLAEFTKYIEHWSIATTRDAKKHPRTAKLQYEMIGKILRLLDCVKDYGREMPKILLVEDGSVDTDALNKWISEEDLPIKVVIYRQGCEKPKILENCDES